MFRQPQGFYRAWIRIFRIKLFVIHIINGTSSAANFKTALNGVDWGTPILKHVRIQKNTKKLIN